MLLRLVQRPLQDPFLGVRHQQVTRNLRTFAGGGGGGGEKKQINNPSAHFHLRKNKDGSTFMPGRGN